MSRAAVLSPCGAYRYHLRRGVPYPDANGFVEPEAFHRSCLFVMLNPSTADASVDDPTVRRCVRFAARVPCGVLEIVNLFAYRSTLPGALMDVEDPVGPDTDAWILRAARSAHVVVVAWGQACARGHRVQPRAFARTVRARVGAVRLLLDVAGVRDVLCLGTTKDGWPRHPLYLRSDARFETYTWGAGP